MYRHISFVISFLIPTVYTKICYFKINVIRYDPVSLHYYGKHINRIALIYQIIFWWNVMYVLICMNTDMEEKIYQTVLTSHQCYITLSATAVSILVGRWHLFYSFAKGSAEITTKLSISIVGLCTNKHMCHK